MSTTSNPWTLYWLFSGSVLGFALLGINSIGLPCALLGVLLLIVGVIFGVVRGRGEGKAGAQAILVGFGGFPALLLLYEVFSHPWACLDSRHGTVITSSSQLNVVYFDCVATPFGPLPNYLVAAAVFGAVAIVGLAWPGLIGLARRVRHMVGT